MTDNASLPVSVFRPRPVAQGQSGLAQQWALNAANNGAMALASASGAPVSEGAADMRSVLTEAAEEITFSFEGRVEEEKTLEERISDYKPPRVVMADRVTEVLQTMLDEEAAAQLERLAKQLAEACTRRQDVLSAVRRWNADPSKQYLALSYALQSQYAEQLAPHQREVLRDGLDRLVMQQGDAVFAGLNTVGEAAQFGVGREQVDLFRRTYRDAVLGYANFSQTLCLLVERFGEQLESGARLLQQALASDLAAVRPSLEPARLQAILQDLYQLSAAVTGLQHCRVVAARMAQLEGGAALSPLALMKDLAQWTVEAWLLAYQVSYLLKRHLPEQERTMRDGRHGGGGREREEGQHQEMELGEDDGEDPELRRQVVFLNGVLEVLRALPPKLFQSHDHRMQAIAVVQQVLDGLLLESP